MGDALCVCPRPYTRRPPSPSRHRARWWQVRCATIPQRHQKGGQRRGKHEAFTVLFCCGCCIAHTELASAMARMVRNMCSTGGAQSWTFASVRFLVQQAKGRIIIERPLD